MNILQISFHTSPFGSVGKFDSGGLNVYVQQVSKQLSNKNNVTVVTAEKAENFKTDNLDFYSLDLFEPCLLYTSPSPRDRQKSRMPSSA